MNKKRVLYALIFLFICVGMFLGGVFAATTINSSSVYYDNGNSGSTATNVQDAIDDIFSKVGSGGGANGVLKVELRFSAVLARNGADNGTYYNRTSSNLITTLSFTVVNGAITSVTNSGLTGTTGKDSWDVQYARITSSLTIASYSWVPSD